MVDIVYILGTGGRHWKDAELRYSLRSVYKHLIGYRNIYIVGERPAWLLAASSPPGSGGLCIHIPCKDQDPGIPIYKERNIMLKLHKACQLPALSQNFLFVNDDHFFNGPAPAFNYPNFYCNTLQHTLNERTSKCDYDQSLKNTSRALHAKGFTAYNFDVHYPISFEKSFFPLVMQLYDWKVRAGYVIKSLYCNTRRLTGMPIIQDCKMRVPMSAAQMHAFVADKSLFSTGPRIEKAEALKFLQQQYPQPSPWEAQ
jgi:hypothetical protein